MKNLLWTDRALRDYDKLVEYLWEEWGEEITMRVRKEIDEEIVRIQRSPEQFPVFINNRQIRRCVASVQTSIFFRVDNNVIEIISLFDNRQNPEKLDL